MQRATPVLETFGKRVFVLGDKPGMGSQMKVINQLLCGVHLAAAGEALGLAHRSGLPMATTLEILKSGAASSWMLGDRGPRMVSESFEDVTSAVDIFVKILAWWQMQRVKQNFRRPLPRPLSSIFWAPAPEDGANWTIRQFSSITQNCSSNPLHAMMPQTKRSRFFLSIHEPMACRPNW